MNTTNVIEIVSALVPEIMKFVREKNAVNGQPPTDTEVIEMLQRDADAIIAKGEAWLASRAPASGPSESASPTPKKSTKTGG